MQNAGVMSKWANYDKVRCVGYFRLFLSEQGEKYYEKKYLYGIHLQRPRDFAEVLCCQGGSVLGVWEYPSLTKQWESVKPNWALVLLTNKLSVSLM